jgi:hypothetical protein
MLPSSTTEGTENAEKNSSNQLKKTGRIMMINENHKKCKKFHDFQFCPLKMMGQINI